MKTIITITKQEIEAAVEYYIGERIDAGYQHKFDKLKLSFTNKDGEIGYFECSAETEVIPKEKQK